jgi:hypothetical protein
LGLAGGGLLAAYIKYSPGASRVPSSMHRQTTTDPGKVKVSHSHFDANNGVTTNNSDETVPSGEDPKVFAINESIHKLAFVAKDAKVLGVDVRDGTAFLDFNKAFDGGYSSAQGGQVLQGVMDTLKQFTEIKQAQFEIDGKPLDSLGEVDTSQPVPITDPSAQDGSKPPSN